MMTMWEMTNLCLGILAPFFGLALVASGAFCIIMLAWMAVCKVADWVGEQLA